MIDILAADRAKIKVKRVFLIDFFCARRDACVAVRHYVDAHGAATLNSNQVDERDPLADLPGVPKGSCFDSLRAIVRPELGYFSIFIYACIICNLVTMAVEPLHDE